ncbi:hypothetical protein ACTXT7_017329 [Hymenolepis weldensis]
MINFGCSGHRARIVHLTALNRKFLNFFAEQEVRCVTGCQSDNFQTVPGRARNPIKQSSGPVDATNARNLLCLSAEIKVLSANIWTTYSCDVPTTSTVASSHISTKNCPPSPLVPISHLLHSTVTPVELANDYAKFHPSVRADDKCNDPEKIGLAKSVSSSNGTVSKVVAQNAGEVKQTIALTSLLDSQVDSFSKCAQVTPIKSVITGTIIKSLGQVFATLDIPQVIVSKMSPISLIPYLENFCGLNTTLLYSLPNLNGLDQQLFDNMKRQLLVSPGEETVGEILNPLRIRHPTTPNVGIHIRVRRRKILRSPYAALNSRPKMAPTEPYFIQGKAILEGCGYLPRDPAYPFIHYEPGGHQFTHHPTSQTSI